MVELPGGLTNQNLRVTTSEATVVGGSAVTPPCSGSTATRSTTTPSPQLRGGRAQVVDYRPDLGVLVIAPSTA